MATNEIKPFGADGTTGAIGSGNDALTVAAYTDDPQRLVGHQAGIARRELENTALRQATHVVSGLAQFIANRYSPGVVDDGDLDKIETGLLDAILAVIAANLPVAEEVYYSNLTSGLTAEDVQAALDEIVAGLPAGIGYDTAYIGGGAMTPSVTDGASPDVVEDSGNALSRSVMLFASDADSSAEFAFPMPDNWDGETIKYKLRWTSAGGSAGDDIGFVLAARALADDDALDQALGTAVAVTDDLIASGDLHVSAASGALTVAGTPAGGKLVRFKLTRDVSSGASPLADDVQVLGLQIQYAITGSVAGW